VGKNRFSLADANGHGPMPHSAAGHAPTLDEAVDDTVDAEAAVDLDGAADFDARGQNEQKEMSVWELFQLLLSQFGELRGYFSYYLSARADSARLGLRNTIFSMALAALAFVVAASLSIAATWLVLSGAAEGFAVLFGNRPWAGNLLTGLLLAASLGCGMYCLLIRLKITAREGTVARYEKQQSRQQGRYGDTVADRAATDESKQK